MNTTTYSCRLRRGTGCIVLATTLLAPSTAVLAAPPPPPAETPAAKFFIAPIIGSLLAALASNALQAMLPPQPSRLQGGQMDHPGGDSPQESPPQRSAPCYFGESGGGIGQTLLAQLLQTGCMYITQSFVSAPKAVGEYVSPTPQPGFPLPELSYSKSGAPNYQGVKLTVVMVDEAGRAVGERPIGNAFYSGERFRLRIQPTFSGLLEIDHIGPSGQRTQLFPKAGMSGFMVTAGSEITLPLGDAIYEFDTNRGTERLIFKVRDPRIMTTAQYGAPMMVQDMGQSTYLGQQMTEDGKYPYISQAVDIQHR